MYIILNHSGSSAHNKLAEDLTDMLEEDGHVVQPVIGNDDEQITLFTEDHRVIANFDRLPDTDTLRFYVEITNEE